MKPHHAPLAVGFLMSLIMTFVISLAVTLFNTGIVPGMVGIWLKNWLVAWIFAFPVILLVGPWARKLVEGHIKRSAQRAEANNQSNNR